MQCAAVDAQVLGYPIGRTQTGRQGQIYAFAGAVPHRGIGPGRHSVEILLNVACDCRVRRRHRYIDIARQADDCVRFLTRLCENVLT